MGFESCLYCWIKELVGIVVGIFGLVYCCIGMFEKFFNVDFMVVKEVDVDVGGVVVFNFV